MPALTSLRSSSRSSSHTSPSSQKLDAIAWLQKLNPISSSASSSSSSPTPLPYSVSLPTTGVFAVLFLLFLGAVRLFWRGTKNNSTVTASVPIYVRDSGSLREKEPGCTKTSHTPHLAPSLPALPALTAAQILSNYSTSHPLSGPPPTLPFTRNRRVYQLGQPLQLHSQSHLPQFRSYYQLQSHAQPLQPYQHTQHAMDGSRGISSVSADSPSRSSASSPGSTPALVNANAYYFDNPSLPPLPLSTSSLSTNAIAGPYAMAPTDVDHTLHSEAADMQSMSFIHQPNPDYGADTEAVTDAASAEPTASETHTRQAPSASSSAATSAPSTSDWTQHTQVYGGGVCLACLAANDNAVGYGDSVPLEMRR